METLKTHRCHGGTLGYYKHRADTLDCDMQFTVFVPVSAKGRKLPVLYFLAGLTCTEENFTAKANAYRLAAELELILVAPDTSPRGEDVADDEAYDLGKGAGFYINATQNPWKSHYQMESYITRELRDVVDAEFPVDHGQCGIFGHSMGGHGALTLALNNPDLYRSVSAFSPICAPTQCSWGEKAFTAYLGDGRHAWVKYDATELVKQGKRVHGTILIDQGTADQFLKEQLHPHLLEAACKEAKQPLTLRMQEGYDHSYFFIQSFMDDHLRHHAQQLGASQPVMPAA